MIGKRIRELRAERGLSQQELGASIGVTKVSICGYENGTRIPNLEKLIKLAEVLETTTDYLLGITSNSSQSLNSGNLNTDISEIAHKLYSLKSDEHLSQKQIEFIKNMIITNKELVLSYHKK